MEDWVIVALVLGSNAIMGAVNWFTTRMQIKNSENQLEKRVQAEREADQRNRRWDVRSQPLLRLRAEIASMAVKLQTSVDLATQVIDGVTQSPDKARKDLEKSVKEWDAYIKSGEFYRVLHMQYDHDLKGEAHRILIGYQSAYMGVIAFWRGGNEDEKIEKISEAKDILKRNTVRISAVQSKISELLEEL